MKTIILTFTILSTFVVLISSKPVYDDTDDFHQNGLILQALKRSMDNDDMPTNDIDDLKSIDSKPESNNIYYVLMRSADDLPKKPNAVKRPRSVRKFNRRSSNVLTTLKDIYDRSCVNVGNTACANRQVVGAGADAVYLRDHKELTPGK